MEIYQKAKGMTIEDLSLKCREKAKKHQFFYHYTNLESLLYILSFCSFRLTLISNVNNIEEEEDRFMDIKKNKVFAACFNHHNGESIPLWKVYSKDSNGLRLDFPNIDFLKDEDRYYHVLEGKKVRFPCEDWEIREADIFDIEYVKDPYEHVSYFDPLDTGAKVPYPINLGIIKRKAWEFEVETRARVYIDVTKRVSSLLKSLKSRNPFINYIYCRLTKDELENMTITFSPFMSSELKDLIKIAVTSHVPYFNPKNFICSEFEKKIRA